jgi:hypothetical protein
VNTQVSLHIGGPYVVEARLIPREPYIQLDVEQPQTHQTLHIALSLPVAQDIADQLRTALEK